MKVIKTINNNYVLAVDKNGSTVVLSGRGIGFTPLGEDVDKKRVNRSFYDVDETYVTMIRDLPEEIILISSAIVDRARNEIDNPISSNIIFTLADHLNFTIQRNSKNLHIKLPLAYDIEHLYEKEYELGLYGIELIKKKLKIYLSKEEASYIAMHLINAEAMENNRVILQQQKIVEEITEIIENECGRKIQRENFNYSRFVTHMYYLLKRGKTKHMIHTENRNLFEEMRDSYPLTYTCSLKVSAYLKQQEGIELTEEELLYLMMHINRLCSREDCNQ